MRDVLHITALVVFTCGALYCGYRWLGQRTLTWAASFLLLVAWAIGNANAAFVSHGHHHEVLIAVAVIAAAGAALLAIDAYLRYFTTRRVNPEPARQVEPRSSETP